MGPFVVHKGRRARLAKKQHSTHPRVFARGVYCAADEDDDTKAVTVPWDQLTDAADQAAAGDEWLVADVLES